VELHKSLPDVNSQIAMAKDPLTPASLLRQLYVLSGSQIRQAVATNSSTPLDLLDEIFASRNAPKIATGLIGNPNLSFERIKETSVSMMGLQPNELSACHNVVEIVDYLMGMELEIYNRDPYFVSRLLRNPHVNEMDYKDRVERYIDFLELEILYPDSRFDPSGLDHLMKDPNQNARIFNAVMQNRNVKTEFLVDATKIRGVRVLAYRNLSCPIELSVSYHIERLGKYQWSPTYLRELEIKANEYLTVTAGDASWEDVPLQWKLKTIAG